MIGEFTCEAGFLSIVFDFLKNERLNCPYLQDVALIFDSMAIRAQLASNKIDLTCTGYINYGSAAEELNISYDKTHFASEVLAFQIVSYSNKFKIPIAHFFINKISADIQTKLIIAAITKLYNVGIIVKSITCDGAATNIKTVNMLGTHFEIENFKCSFTHPCNNNSNIYIFMDPCHMLKLCRNTMSDTVLYSQTGRISFTYIHDLHKLQEQEGFKFANKLSQSHIHYRSKKMKVKLAAQTISNSVADAINYLRISGNPIYADSEATTEFIRVFDHIFDLLNSRSAYARNFKAPLTLSNLSYWDNVLSNTENFIKQLKIGNTPVLNHSRKMFALGFLINLKSIR